MKNVDAVEDVEDPGGTTRAMSGHYARDAAWLYEMYMRVHTFAFTGVFGYDDGTAEPPGFLVRLDATTDVETCNGFLELAYELYCDMLLAADTNGSCFLYPDSHAPGGEFFDEARASAVYTFDKAYADGKLDHRTSTVRRGTRSFLRWRQNVSVPFAFLADRRLTGRLERRVFEYDSDSSSADDSGYTVTSRVTRRSDIRVPAVSDWIGDDESGEMDRHGWGERFPGNGPFCYYVIEGLRFPATAGGMAAAVRSPISRFVPRLAWIPRDVLVVDDSSGSDEEDAVMYVTPVTRTSQYPEYATGCDGVTDRVFSGMRVEAGAVLGDREDSDG